MPQKYCRIPYGPDGRRRIPNHDVISGSAACPLPENLVVCESEGWRSLFFLFVIVPVPRYPGTLVPYVISYLFTGCRLCRRAPKLDGSMARCLDSWGPARWALKSLIFNDFGVFWDLEGFWGSLGLVVDTFLVTLEVLGSTWLPCDVF